MPLAWGSDEATVMKLSEKGTCNTSSICFSFRSSDINISTNNNLKVLVEKTRGRYLYLLFLEDYLIKVKERLHNKMERLQYKGIENSFLFSYYIDSLFIGAELSPFREMQTYFKYLSRKGLFKGKLDKIHFFWSWIRAYKTRKG